MGQGVTDMGRKHGGLKYVDEWFDEETRQTYRYFRRKRVRIRLPGQPGSEEFMEVYKEALKGTTATTRVSKIHKKDSVGDLIANYQSSVEFRNLKPGSKSRYRGVLSRFGDKHGHLMVRATKARHARKIIQDIGATKPGAANFARSVLRTLFEFAIDLEMRSEEQGNPFRRIKPYKGGAGHHSWTDDELKAYRKRWPLGTVQRLAYAVLLYTDQRISDAVKLKRADILSVTQEKTGADVRMPVHPALARAIKAMTVVSHDGRLLPMTKDQLGDMVATAAVAAKLENCTAHGLRKANQRLLAENDATTFQMRAVSGHKTTKEAERYAAAANRARLAAQAIAKLPDETDEEQEVPNEIADLALEGSKPL